MKRFLLCCGVHARADSLLRLAQAIEDHRPDAVLFAGGVLDMPRTYAPTSTTQWGLTREDAQFIELFFETLGRLGVFSAVVPGPADTPLEDFIRMGMHAEIEYPAVHLAHATLLQQGDLAISGMGGTLREDHSGPGMGSRRTFVEYHLRPLWTVRQSRRILLLSNPPTGKLGGDDGSSLVGELIDSYHPDLCVVNGPSPFRGIERIARTLVVNPGSLSDGWAVLLDTRRPVDQQAEFLDLRAVTMPAPPAEIGVGD